MLYLRMLVHSTLLLTLPSAFYPQSCFAAEVQESTWKPPLSYDGILNFFDELESGELEKKCSLSDLEKINYFLASLAKAGVLPNEPEEQLSIENDIEELLYNEQDSDDYIFSLGEEEEPLIISAVFHGTRQTLLCKTWVHKKWDQTKKFTKNHKKALIIGTVLVVVAVVTMDPAQPLPYLQRGIAHFGLGQYERSLEDYREFVAQTQKTQPVSPTEFSLGFAKGLPQGIYDSAEDLFLFLTDLISHPITTAGQACDSFSMLSQLAYTQQWEALSEALVPEVRQLVEDWDHLSPEKQGEQAGYLFGKYGSNLVIPGAATKVIASGVKGARELSLIQKSLQTTQQTLLLESVASIDAGANIADVIQTSRNSLQIRKGISEALSRQIHAGIRSEKPSQRSWNAHISQARRNS